MMSEIFGFVKDVGTGGHKEVNMKVYDVTKRHNYSQIHSVVADSMAKAEEIYLKKHPSTEIIEIRLHSSHVQIQDVPHVILNSECQHEYVAVDTSGSSEYKCVKCGSLLWHVNVKNVDINIKLM